MSRFDTLFAKLKAKNSLYPAQPLKIVNVA